MKKLIILFAFIFGSALYAQDNPRAVSSTWDIGVLGGTNFANSPGGSFIVELKRNFSDKLTAKASLGYSYIKTSNPSYGYSYGYRYDFFTESGTYTTYDYKSEETSYLNFHLSLGAEYYFVRNDKISPYGLFEIGTNFFDKKVGGKTTLLNSGTYDSFDNMPEANRSHSSKALDTSFRLALGAGTKYNLTQYIGLDFRFVYQFNAAIGNNSQLLFGVVF